MKTKHDAVEDNIFELVKTVFQTATREDELPRECPQEGVVNLTFSTPEEVGRRFGEPVREISRKVDIEIVVPGADNEERREKLGDIKVALGLALTGADFDTLGVDHLEVGEPIDPEVIPMSGSESLRGTTVPLELLYETSNNPMEIAQ